MLYIIFFLILTLCWYLYLRGVFSIRLAKKQEYGRKLAKELNTLEDSKNKLDKEKVKLEKEFEDNRALYEVTKEICKNIDEEKVFSTFNKSLKEYIEIGDCRYIKETAELSKYKNYTILPLNIEENQVGYLAVDRLGESDKEKFAILAQQFLSGLRRALLYRKVEELTITDSMTGVYCRRYFLERFSQELKRSKKNKLFLSFLMIDIDNFKQFNDRYGHLVGDAILRHSSKTINEAVRQIDFIGRYGGEELSIVLSETDREQAAFAAERIRQAIAGSKVKIYDEELSITISIGVSTFPDNAATMQDLIESADQALYLAKETGKNRVCFSPP